MQFIGPPHSKIKKIFHFSGPNKDLGGDATAKHFTAKSSMMIISDEALFLVFDILYDSLTSHGFVLHGCQMLISNGRSIPQTFPVN